MDIGKIGIWTAQFDARPRGEVAEAAAELDELGYGAIWVHEVHGREPLTQAALLPGATPRIPVATGIAVICGRDPVVLECDPDRAREIARRHTVPNIPRENDTNNLRRFGFADEDVRDGGSDRLVDAIVGWGSIDRVAGRVRERPDAGADHVCIRVLPREPGTLPREESRELAAALPG